MDDIDERVLQEFAELQDKALMQTEMSGRAQQQGRMLGIQHQRCVLTKKELLGMPDETTMYKSIGRAYFSSPKPDVIKELDERAVQIEADAKRLQEQRDAIDQKMKDTESQIRELLQQSPSLVLRLGAVKIQ